MIIRTLGLLAFALSLSACAAFPKMFDTLFGTTREPATETPLYTYRADLLITVDGKTFDGVGVTLAQDETYLQISSLINLDRVEIETCSRQDVCQNGKNCASSFYSVETGWFGSPGKRMIYHYVPNAIEKQGKCPIYVKVFDKQALAAWGFVAFRNGVEENLSAHFACNGIGWTFAGHSMCQTKAGLIQEISFEQDIDDFDVDESCNVTKVDNRNFRLRPDRGLCTGMFHSKGKYHALELIAYKTVLVRGS